MCVCLCIYIYLYTHVCVCACEWQVDQWEWLPSGHSAGKKWTEALQKFPSHHPPPSFPYFPTLALSLPLRRRKDGFTFSSTVQFLCHHFHHRLLIGCLNTQFFFSYFLSPLELLPEFVPREDIQKQPHHLQMVHQTTLSDCKHWKRCLSQVANKQNVIISS